MIPDKDKIFDCYNKDNIQTLNIFSVEYNDLNANNAVPVNLDFLDRLNFRFEENKIYFLGPGNFKLGGQLLIDREKVILVGAPDYGTTITKRADRDGVYVTGDSFGMLRICLLYTSPSPRDS